MSKVFTSKQFIEKLKWLVNDVPNVYHSGKGWSELNKNGKWQFDCVVSVKCLLWGFKADKKLFRGGTIYKSNNVKDFTCNGALDLCSEVSTDFSHLIAGEYLCMKGTKYNHTGIYLGNGKVFEDTTGWGTNKAIISDINSKGERSYKGSKSLRWTYHGKLCYIDYTDQKHEKNQVEILQSKMNEQWNLKLAEDGIFGPLTRKACREHYLQKDNKYRIMNKWLQQRLIDKGFSVGKSGVDGYFGKDTRKAVKDFQKKFHLVIDGIVGENTYKALTE